MGAVGFDAVKHLVLCRVEKRPPKLDLDVYPYLPRATVARTSAASYMCLVSGECGMTDAPEILLAHHLKTLKLPTFLREYEKLARQCATEGLDHVRFLARLVELELIDRERRMIERRIKAARFPAVKSLDSFDFKAIPSLNKMQVLELARCEWIERRENVIALGPSGTGKSHVALGLGLAACQKGLSVGFTTAAALVHELMEARDERRLLRLQKQMAGHKLLIIDELGFVPLSKTGAELLFELISQRYERGATLITSNLPFDEWTETFGSERLTGALLDRLTHHVTILEMNGDSYRLAQSRTQKNPSQRLTPGNPVGPSGQRALAHASYPGSARAKARHAPSRHHYSIPEVVDFCAAPWLVFPPPLTPVEVTERNTLDGTRKVHVGLHNSAALVIPVRLLTAEALDAIAANFDKANLPLATTRAARLRQLSAALRAVEQIRKLGIRVLPAVASLADIPA